MSITLYKTITEHFTGRIKDETSSTGYKRRAGSENYLDARGKRQVRSLYEEAPAPRTFVYGSPEHIESGVRGGTVHTIVEGVEPQTRRLEADEIEYLLRKYAREYEDGHFVLNGNTISGRPISTQEAHEMVNRAKARAKRFGVDLDKCGLRDF